MNNRASPITPEIFLADTRDKDFNTKNISNYKLLVDTWNVRKSVSFLGAGTSSPLGIKDWRDLVCSIQKLVRERYCKEIDIDENDLPLVAEKLFKEFELNNQGADFDSIVFKNVEPSNNSTTVTLIKLAKLLDIHFTTNFDQSLFGAYDFIKIENIAVKSVTIHAIPDLPSYYQILRGNGAHIIYLHGKKDGPYVFKSRDYEKFYPSIDCGNYSKCIEDCLKAFLKEVSFLFVGFSFKDVRLKEMIFKVISEIKKDILINTEFLGTQVKVYSSEMPRHYLLAHNDEQMYGNVRWDDFYREFEQYNIYPVIYQKEKHIFLEHLIDHFINKGYL